MNTIKLKHSGSGTPLFLLLVVVSILITLLFQEFLITTNLYYEHFGSKLTASKLQEILDFKDQWSWLNYVATPLIYVIKFTLISLWLLVATVFAGYRTSYKTIFQATILAEFVMLIPVVLKLVWFGFVQTDYSLTDLQLFNPFSLISLFDAEQLAPWLLYPIQSVNLLEIPYILLLTMGMKKAIDKDFATTLRFVLPS